MLSTHLQLYSLSSFDVREALLYIFNPDNVLQSTTTPSSFLIPFSLSLSVSLCCKTLQIYATDRIKFRKRSKLINSVLTLHNLPQHETGQRSTWSPVMLSFSWNLSKQKEELHAIFVHFSIVLVNHYCSNKTDPVYSNVWITSILIRAVMHCTSAVFDLKAWAA